MSKRRTRLVGVTGKLRVEQIVDRDPRNNAREVDFRIAFILRSKA